MTIIGEIVEKSFSTGCLSIAAESRLRGLLRRESIDTEDIKAFSLLEQAIAGGKIKQESQELHFQLMAQVAVF
ncbi:hypothetical protein [Lyngbya aestuarii]|uniref:hypothetical protein n=1 Tax=Lyngbya aestuarii TaxID=118322 RepID=UPI00403E3000